MGVRSLSHRFKEDEPKGKSWEISLYPYLKFILKDIIPNIKGSIIRNIENVEMQRLGIDYEVFTESDILCGDCKYRSHKYHWCQDILLETESDSNRLRSGWLYKNKIDFVVYFWEDNLGRWVVDLYVIYPLKEVREWFDRIKGRSIYRKIESRNEGYITISYAIPLQDFPEGTLHKVSNLITNLINRK